MKLDLHIHTNYSDGTASPESIVRHAVSIGLDGIAITDHDTIQGMLVARSFAKKLGLLIVPGLEITTDGGDILALGVDKMPKISDKHEEIIKDIHKNGGIAIIAHPFAGSWPRAFTNNKKLMRMFDAIEIYNALTSLERNIEAMELAKKLKKPGIAGSDSHFIETIGSAFIMIERKTDDIQEILHKIKNGDFKIGWV